MKKKLFTSTEIKNKRLQVRIPVFVRGCNFITKSKRMIHLPVPGPI